MHDILPVLDKATYEKVAAAALADDHYALAPTHYWTNENQEISGYFSNGMVQVTHFWQRRGSKPRESVQRILQCKELAKTTNPIIRKHGSGIICCAESSPFYGLLEKHFNFQPLTRTVLFLAEV